MLRRILLLLLLGLTPAAAQPAAFSLGGKPIPLPPGAWVILGEAEYPAPGEEAPAIRSLVLGLLAEGRLLALVAARGNLAPAATGFGIAAECRRRDLHLAWLETPAASPLAACGFLLHVLHAVPEGADPAWRTALARLDQDGVQVPPAWLAVGFRLADADDLLDIRYLLDPRSLGLAHPADLPAAAPGPVTQAEGWVRDRLGLAGPGGSAAWQASGWGKAAVAEDPPRAWVVAQLAGWAEDLRAPIRQGFKGRAAAIAWPGPWQVAYGLLPPPAHWPGPVLPAPAGAEALWKTVSWRGLGSVLDLAFGYALGGGGTLLGGLVQATAYYTHERVWTRLGAAGAPARRLTELPEIGVAR